MHYYKKNIGDYHKKAGRLSMLEHGAYTLLMDSCYDRERFPTLEEAIEWTWARTEEEIAAIRFVLAKFFILEDGIYTQNRIDEEVKQYHLNSATNKKIAQDREAKRRTNRARTVNEPPPKEHEPPPNQEPRTINQEPLKSKALSGKPDNMPENTPTKKQNLTKEAQEVIEHLNLVAGSKFQPVEANIKLVVARIKEGATMDEMKRVIDVRVAKWINDPTMGEYLRPATLFNATNYANYAGQLETAAPKKERGFVC